MACLASAIEAFLANVVYAFHEYGWLCWWRGIMVKLIKLAKGCMNLRLAINASCFK
jgi:hypothetical protein